MKVKKLPLNIVSIVPVTLLILVLLVGGCGGKTPGNTNGGNGNGGNGEDVVITVGNLTDQTGVASEPMSYIEMALEDIVEYYNENNLIPGVRLRVTDYDDQYDPARDIPGYRKLKSDGADFIWTPVTLAVPVLKPILDRDKFVLFVATANMPKHELEGGYVFSMGITPRNEAYTLLEWLPENDEDFPEGRPALIGAAAWNDGYSNLLFEAAKDYADAHPDKYKWDKTFLTDFSFSWKVEADALKDCDYVFLPTPPHVFVRDFRDAGGTAKFLATDPCTAFLGIIGDSGLWDEVDGSLFIRSSRWYNETGPIIDITNQLLEEKHSASEAAEIRRQGCGYIATKNQFLMLDIVRKAVEEVGPENFDSQALYDAAITWEYEYEGIPKFNNFDANKRIAQNYYAVYEADAALENIVRAHTDWLPEVDTVD